MVFEIKKGKAVKINSKEFKNELELHQLIDKNLEELFEIRYIKDEHVTDKHGRIETLGIDSSNRPVVIEYKKTKEKGQLVQANRYLMWIRQHRSDFELLVLGNLKIEVEIDFDNPRIICFAQDYDIDDKCLALALGAGVELWKYQYYENDTLVIIREEEPEQLIKSKSKNNNFSKKVGTTKTVDVETKKTKTVDEHLIDSSEEIKSIFEDINNGILNLGSDIECYTTRQNILYKTSVIFVELKVQRSKLRLLLRTKNSQIYDPKNLTERVKETHGWGNLTHIVYVDPAEVNKKYSIDDILYLISQSYNVTK